MEVDEAPKEEDVGKTQEPCETSEEEGEAMETGITPPPSLVTELGEHPPEVSQNDGQTSGEEGELSMSEDEGSPQRMAPASPAKVTASKHVSESGKHSELHTSDQLTEGMQAHETGAASGSEHGTPSCEDNRLTNCSTSHSVDKETLSDKTQVDKQCLAKNSSRGSEDHNTSEDTDRNLDANNIDLLASGDNDNVHHDKKCTKPTVTTIDRLSGDVRNEDDKVMAKNEKQRLSKTSLHDEPVELDYEEEGIEDSESLANTGGDDSKELEMGELDEKEEGEHSDSDGEISDDQDEGEVIDDDDCEEGEIKDQASGRRPFTRYVCRFYLRGHCTWGPNCRFVHPGVNDKGNYSMMDQPFMQGPPVRVGHRGPMPRGPPGPWVEMPSEPDLPPPTEDPPTETAWERGLRQAKELRMKASKRKEMEVDFEEKRMHLTLEEEKDHNKENEERTRSIVNKDPPYYEPYELDEYYDKEVHDNWRLGQYENFEVRWNREPADYPPPYNRGPEKERMIVDKRRNRDMMRYSPVRRIDRRKEKVDKHERVRRGDKPEQHSAPMKARVDEWQDPWQRTKSPKRKRSSSRSRSRGRLRARRSNSRGSFSSSYSSSSFSSRSRSSSSYSSYSSRSSASRSSSFSSRSSSRSKSRSPRRHNWKQSGTGPKVAGSFRTSDAAPKSTVSRLGHPSSQGAAAAGTLGAAIAAERKKATQPPQPSAGMRGQPSSGMRGQPSAGTRGQSSSGMRGQPSSGMRGQPPGHASSRAQTSSNSRTQPSGASRNQPPPTRNQPPPPRGQPPAHAPSRAQPPSHAASRAPAAGVSALRAAPVKGPSPLPLAAAADRSRKPNRHSAVSARERGRRSGSSSNSSHSSSLSRSSSASSISSSSASSGSADSEHLYRDIGSPAGSKQTVSPKKKIDKSKRDDVDEKKELRGKPKDVEKKTDKVPSGNTAGRKEPHNSGRTETKNAAPGKSMPTKGTTKNSNKQQPKVQTSSSTSGSAAEKPPSTKSAASLAVRMQVKSTSLLKQPARMPERNDSKSKITAAPTKQDEKNTASRNSEDKVSSSTKTVPRTAPALQSASVPAAMAVQPAKTKDLLKVAGQKSSIKLTLINKSEKASSRKRPAPESDSGIPATSPVKRPSKPPVHGATKDNAARHPEKAVMRPNSPKGKSNVPHRQAPTATAKNTANASGATSAPKKSMSSRREELLKQLKAVEDAIARKRAKMN